MKVLLVNGSPHKRGCTYTALSEIAKTLDEEQIDWDIFHIGNKPVRGCTACDSCRNNNRPFCVYGDDPCNDLIDQIQHSDGLIIGSPVYYAGANGALCAILDRVFYSAQQTFKHKPAAAIVSCRRGGASATFDRLNKYFTINQMPLVSSQYWNSVHGMTPDEVLQDKEGLQVMRTLAHNMAWLLRSTANTKPKEETQHQSTNFIR